MTAEIAKMIDHSLLHPTLTDADLRRGCKIAELYDVASVCIKPYAVREAVDWLKGSGVQVGTVIGFPHGNSTISIKTSETEQACRNGATEIDMVVNIGRVLSQDWEYIGQEIQAILTVVHNHQAILKVIFENDFLPEDHYKIRLCEICSELHVDFVKTSTGYGMVKNTSGTYSYQGATEYDLRLMRKHSGAHVQVKAAGGVRTLDDAIKVKQLGVTRIGASATVKILNEAYDRFGGTKPVLPAAGEESEGY